MKAKAEDQGGQLDWLKWGIAALITVAAIWANFHYAGVSLAYRFVGGVVLAAIAGAIAFQTTQGALFWDLAKAARIEIRKVVWPTRQEATQTTLIVVLVVVVAALILWGLDTLLGWIASKLMG